ncbi:uncharacterized protein F4812DRAFT_415210 [Daldinia caldariorum]|uniref:uncharacterized protein n=1 Tax=Daldinia caldariorum TaxID=326644 RepID=UPI002008E359|nr:uncharacterized protein F4812DRAFT_415210 [Daldinia caldariorum]KAI1471718.1 hypothetical protein F4812DRAFT_415210 [Daldinia caldariorum]
MYSSSMIYLLNAIASLPLVALANAGPTQALVLAERQYQNKCCLPGCLQCSIDYCQEEPCSGVYNSCCAEGRREVGEDGEIQIFNVNGEKMEFVK